MPALIQAYLYFNGCCEEALKFYETAIDARLDYVMRFNESPEPVPAEFIPEGFDDKIMHCSFTVGDCVIMASDGCEVGANFKGFSLSIAVDDEATAHRYYEALAVGGKIDMPIGKTFWSPCFGMVTDQFGMSWMVTVKAEA